MVWLQKIATGALKWKPDEFEVALIPDILLAYEGHIDDLKLIHGNEDKPTNQMEPTAENFDMLFGSKD